MKPKGMLVFSPVFLCMAVSTVVASEEIIRLPSLKSSSPPARVAPQDPACAKVNVPEANRRLIDTMRNSDYAATMGILSGDVDVNFDDGGCEFAPPLFFAAYRGKPEIVAALLNKGANVHATDTGYPGGNALHSAIRGAAPFPLRESGDFSEDRMATIRLLLARGVDPNKINRQDAPALIVALTLFHQKPGPPAVNDIVQLLLEHGANPKYANKGGQHVLDFAAGAGYAQAVQMLIKSGADPRAGDSRALHLAAENNHLEVLKILLKSGADSRADNSRAAYLAANNNHPEALKLLLSKGADPNGFPKGHSPALFTAVGRDSTEIASILLAYGADPNITNEGFVDPKSVRDVRVPIMRATEKPAMFKLLMDHGANVNFVDSYDQTMLSRAITSEKPAPYTTVIFRNASGEDEKTIVRQNKDNRLDTIRNLLKYGADPNLKSKGKTMLMLTRKEGDIDVIQALMDKGGVVDFEKVISKEQDRQTEGIVQGPITWTVFEGRHELRSALLNRDKKIGPSDQYAIYYASKLGQAEVVSALLKYGANPNVRDRADVTPLIWAANGGHLEVVKLLLGKSADVNASTITTDPEFELQLKAYLQSPSPMPPYGQIGHGSSMAPLGGNMYGGDTALIRAAKRGHIEIAKVLIAHGANPNMANRHPQYGSSPLSIARARGDAELVRILQKAGATQ